MSELSQVYSFQLPTYRLPGSDIMSKHILQHKFVIDIVVGSLVGTTAKDCYGPWPTQWPNGKISDVVYMPFQDVPAEFPPVIVEVQHTVDFSFMFRVMSYCNQLFLQSKRVPIVLIFGISKIKHDVLTNCRRCRSHRFLLQYRKETWAQACYLVDRESIQSLSQDLPLDPLISLSLFLTGKHRSLSADPFSDDPTIQLLYGIAKDLFESQIRIEDNVQEECVAVCKCVDEKINQGLSKLRSGQELEGNTKAQIEIDLVAASTLLNAFSSKYERSASSSPPPQQQQQQQQVQQQQVQQQQVQQQQVQQVQQQPQSEEDQWAFAKKYVESLKPATTTTSNRRVTVPWEAIFREGRAKGYFRTYKSSNTMRTAFYRKYTK